MSSPSPSARLLRRLAQARFPLLAALLCTVVLLHLRNGRFWGDAWEHAAVIAEYAQSPLAPRHPIFGTDDPHKGLHPYHLLVGICARTMGWTGIEALTVFSVVNLLLLLLLLHRFVSTVAHRNAPFWALAFIVLLWPERPWIFSAFVHIRAISLVAGYPSTFAMALTFGAWSLYATALRGGGRIRYLPLALLTTTVTLVHPLTAAMLWIGLVALLLGSSRERVRDAGAFALLLAGSVACVLLWPHYPFWRLASAGPEATVGFHSGSATFYNDALKWAYPTLVALPALALAVKRRWSDPLVLLLAGLTGLYFVARWIGMPFFGRSISFIAITAQIVLADWVARCESSPWRKSWRSIPRALYLALVLAALVLCIRANAPGVVKDHVRKHRPNHPDLSFVVPHVRPYEVVLTDLGTSYVLPTLGRKVVAHKMGLLFAPSRQERLKQLDRFLGRSSLAQRREILRRYDVRFILLSRRNVRRAAQIERQLRPVASRITRHGDFVLLRVRGQR